MYLLGLGIVFMLLKYLAIGPVADWSWWWVLSPFALAAIWWVWADASGYTKRKQVETEEKRIAARRQRTKDALSSIAPKKRR